jgi:VCBS repeat-containing protein
MHVSDSSLDEETCGAQRSTHHLRRYPLTAKRMLIGVFAVVTIALGFGNAAAQAATVTWHPQSTIESAGLGAGSKLVLTDNAGNTVTCTTVSANVEAPISGNAAVAGTVNSSGTAAPPSITSCSSNLGSASVTASGQWLFTATSATTVDASQASATARVAGLCTITVSNAAIANNTWNNTTHQATINSSVSTPISESGLCDGATSATLSGVLQLPSTVTIS